MTIVEKIISIYPELKEFNFSSGVIVLRNDTDDRGDYIAEWNHPTLSKPTDEQLKGL
jgi:hypothetical protein